MDGGEVVLPLTRGKPSFASALRAVDMTLKELLKSSLRSKGLPEGAFFFVSLGHHFVSFKMVCKFTCKFNLNLNCKFKYGL